MGRGMRPSGAPQRVWSEPSAHILLTIKNRRASPFPDPIGAEDRLGYFDSDRGEQLVFVQRPGEATARLYIAWKGGWKRHRLRWTGPKVLSHAEAAWAAGCFEASAHLRPGGE